MARLTARKPPCKTELIECGTEFDQDIRQVLIEQGMVVTQASVADVLQALQDPSASAADVVQALQDRKQFVTSKMATCFLCGFRVLAVDWTRHAHRECARRRLAEPRRHTRSSECIQKISRNELPANETAPLHIMQASIHGCTEFKCSKCGRRFQLGQYTDVHVMWRAWRHHSREAPKCRRKVSDREPELISAHLVACPEACCTLSSRSRTPSPEWPCWTASPPWASEEPEPKWVRVPPKSECVPLPRWFPYGLTALQC